MGSVPQGFVVLIDIVLLGSMDTDKKSLPSTKDLSIISSNKKIINDMCKAIALGVILY